MKNNLDKDFEVLTREDFLKDIVNQLKLRRIALNLTQADVDNSMGNADRLVSKWECGDRTPTAFNLYCWTLALKTKMIIQPI